MEHYKRMSKGEALTLTDFQGQATTTHERRREQRIPCDKQIAILPCIAARRQWSFRGVGLFDCSPHGLCIIDDEPMKPGEQFLAKLQLEKLMLVLYTVRHCTPIAPLQFKIGAEFSTVISGAQGRGPEAVMQALMQAAT